MLLAHRVEVDHQYCGPVELRLSGYKWASATLSSIVLMLKYLNVAFELRGIDLILPRKRLGNG